jgi:hypothetical protein
VGSELPDADLYRARGLSGGLACTPESLRWIFSDLVGVELRRMREQPLESELSGEPFLSIALFRRDAVSAASGDVRCVRDLAQACVPALLVPPDDFNGRNRMDGDEAA